MKILSDKTFEDIATELLNFVNSDKVTKDHVLQLNKFELLFQTSAEIAKKALKKRENEAV